MPTTPPPPLTTSTTPPHCIAICMHFDFIPFRLFHNSTPTEYGTAIDHQTTTNNKQKRAIAIALILILENTCVVRYIIFLFIPRSSKSNSPKLHPSASWNHLNFVKILVSFDLFRSLFQITSIHPFTILQGLIVFVYFTVLLNSTFSDNVGGESDD